MLSPCLRRGMRSWFEDAGFALHILGHAPRFVGALGENARSTEPALPVSGLGITWSNTLRVARVKDT
jgi:hypothetical protein